MIVSHRLRKFHPLDEGQEVPRMIWCKWFKTREEAQKFAAEDSTSDVVWIGMSALSEEHTYDIKRFELTGL